MKGQRLATQSTKKEKFRAMETQVQNLEMALRINQMMVQQLMQRVKDLGNNVGQNVGQLGELRYRLLAYQQLANLPLDQVNTIAAELRLKDFNEFSDKENEKEGYTPGTTVNEDSIVIVTSTTDEPNDAGIFRSKLKLAECGVPDLIKAFSGREVGAKAIVELNGISHTVELLSIFQPPKVVAVESTPAPTLTVVPNEATPQA